MFAVAVLIALGLLSVDNRWAHFAVFLLPTLTLILSANLQGYPAYPTDDEKAEPIVRLTAGGRGSRRRWWRQGVTSRSQP